MKSWGLGLIGLGAFIALVALVVMPSTVSTEEMTTLPYTGSVIGSGRYTETYNMPRAQLREMVFHGGGFVFLAGIVLLVGGMLEERIARLPRARSGAAHVTGDPAPSSFEPRRSNEANGSAEDERHAAAPVYDHAAAQSEAIRNKEMAAWVFSAFVVIALLVFSITQIY